jgi:hypothetical protein
MQLQLNITSDSPAELATLLAALAPHFASVSTPVEAVISHVQPVEQDATPKRTRAPKAVAADPVAAYNAMAAAAGALPVVDGATTQLPPPVGQSIGIDYAKALAGMKAGDQMAAFKAVIKEDADLLSALADAPVVEEPKPLDRNGKILFIVEKIKKLTLPIARITFAIPNDAPAFSMWAEGEIERVYALAVAA